MILKRELNAIKSRKQDGDHKLTSIGQFNFYLNAWVDIPSEIQKATPWCIGEIRGTLKAFETSN